MLDAKSHRRWWGSCYASVWLFAASNVIAQPGKDTTATSPALPEPPPQAPASLPEPPPPEPPPLLSELAPAPGPRTFDLHRFAFGIGLGVHVAGWGSNTSECSGNACTAVNRSSREYTHRIGPMLEAHAFYQLLSLLRLGSVVVFSPGSSVEFDHVEGTARSEFGSMVNFNAAVELTPRLGHRVWLLPRIQSGLTMLFPSGRLATGLRTLRSNCEESNGAFVNCDSLDGARFGGNLGLGLGLRYAATDELGLRFDGSYEYYSVRLATLNPGNVDAKYVENATGGRLMFALGMEL